VAYGAKSLDIWGCDGRDMPMVAQQLQELPTHDILIILALTAKNLWSIFHSSGSLDNGCATVGISRLSHKEVTV
jgi:hypothetical protein